MTREELKEHCLEQIEMCEIVAKCKGEKPSGKLYEKHKLILELLEQEPTTKNDLGVDTVSRKAVLNQIFYSTDNSGDVVLGSALRERIERLPSVIPEPSWIPVSERLPKEDGRYLVTVQNLTGYERLDNNVFECEFFYTDWIFKGWKDNKVIAWMPKPREYKAESEG